MTTPPRPIRHRVLPLVLFSGTGCGFPTAVRTGSERLCALSAPGGSAVGSDHRSGKRNERTS